MGNAWANTEHGPNSLLSCVVLVYSIYQFDLLASVKIFNAVLHVG